MRKLLFLLLFVLAVALPVNAQPENPGPYNTAAVTVQLQRGARNLPTTIRFPAVPGGSLPDTAHGPYPVIVFGHGFLTQVSWYTSLLTHLASYGFIVAAPQFPDTQHGELADDMIAVLQWLHSENSRQQSQFYKLADTLRSGVTGHSMGGGASLLAAGRSSKITLAAPLAPAETTPSVIAVMNKIRSVLYIIAGDNDGITPVATNQLPMYNAALPCKTLLTIKGANHTRFMDNAALDFSDPRGYLARTVQLRITRRYLTSVCNLILHSDTSYAQYLFGPPAVTDTQVVRQFTSGPAIPGAFTQTAPTGLLSINAPVFQWRASSPLIPGNSVRYTLRLYRNPSLTDSSGIAVNTQDTTASAGVIPSGIWYWQVTAYTSDSTKAVAPAVFILVPGTTGINTGITEKKNFSVYPNPAQDVITVTSAAESELILYSITGKEQMRTVIPSDKHTFSVPGLSPGVYVYVIRNASAVRRGKFVVGLVQ